MSGPVTLFRSAFAHCKALQFGLGDSKLTEPAIEADYNLWEKHHGGLA